MQIIRLAKSASSWGRRVNSSVPGEARRESRGPVAGSVLLTGTDVTCATGETAEYLFREEFERTTSGTSIQSWSASPHRDLDRRCGDTFGTLFRTSVRAHGNTVTAESSRRLSLLVDSVCQGVTLTTGVPSPQSLGTPIRLSGAGTCTAGVCEYAFQVTTPAGVVSALSDANEQPLARPIECARATSDTRGSK